MALFPAMFPVLCFLPLSEKPPLSVEFPSVEVVVVPADVVSVLPELELFFVSLVCDS